VQFVATNTLSFDAVATLNTHILSEDNMVQLLMSSEYKTNEKRRLYGTKSIA